MQDASGAANFPDGLVNPETGKPIASWYNAGQVQHINLPVCHTLHSLNLSRHTDLGHCLLFHGLHYGGVPCRVCGHLPGELTLLHTKLGLSLTLSLATLHTQCVNKEVLKIFGHEGADGDDIVYANWLSMARAGLLALM